MYDFICELLLTLLSFPTHTRANGDCKNNYWRKEHECDVYRITALLCAIHTRSNECKKFIRGTLNRPRNKSSTRTKSKCFTSQFPQNSLRILKLLRHSSSLSVHNKTNLNPHSNTTRTLVRIVTVGQTTRYSPAHDIKTKPYLSTTHDKQPFTFLFPSLHFRRSTMAAMTVSSGYQSRLSTVRAHTGFDEWPIALKQSHFID